MGEYRKPFYTNLKLFLKDLIVVFPEDDEELQIISTSLNLAIIDDDANEIIIKFYNSLSKLETDILNRDIIIFTKDPANYWDTSSYEYKLFCKFNENWNTFKADQQKILWDYIQVLYGLSKKFTLNLI